MILRDALGGVERLGLDTSPIIYLVEKRPMYFDQILLIADRITQGSIVGISSVLVLAEVLVHPYRLGNDALARAYTDILLNSAGFSLIDVDSAIASRAAALRVAYDLRLPDALHIATALETGCDAFLTNDLAFKRVQELRILVLDELEPPG